MHKIQLKRAYDTPDKADGVRILVERLWPRGLTKEKAKVDLWLKEVAPSNELRKWYDHKIERWAQFRLRYGTELKGNKQAVAALLKEVSAGDVTFVYAASDIAHNSAVVLKAFIETVSK
jgi:uncharacterized protein YeaO (DUF488 family)